MSSKRKNISEFNLYIKSDKIQYVVYGHLESLIKNSEECENYPEKLSTLKIGEILFADVQC